MRTEMEHRNLMWALDYRTKRPVSNFGGRVFACTGLKGYRPPNRGGGNVQEMIRPNTTQYDDTDNEPVT